LGGEDIARKASPRSAKPSPPKLTAFLYDAEGRDREVAFTPQALRGLNKRALIWIDLAARTEPELRAVAAILDLTEASTADLLRPRPRLRLDNYGGYFQFGVYTTPGAILRPSAAPGDGESPARLSEAALDQAGRDSEISQLDFLVGDRWVLTVHDRDLAFLRGFRDQDKADTMIGVLSPQSFVASLIDWHLETYFEEVALIESIIDRLDERVLADPSSKSLLPRMLAIRRRIARLRRLLAAQRPVLYGLGRPDVALLAPTEAAPPFEGVAGRFDRAVDELEHTRELVLGSFELLTSRMSQETNDLVKALTFVTVIIGATAAVAGLFGMNFDPPFFDTGSAGFFAVTGGLLLLAAAAAWVARRKGWI